MPRMEWNDRLMTLIRECAERLLLAPRAQSEEFFLPDEREFLASIGVLPAAMLALLREYTTQGLPSPTTLLLVLAQRRAFFKTSQRGISGTAAAVKATALPPETEELQGMPYLPYLIRKAEAVLFGTLDPELFYPDAKDRQFLQENGAIHPADFLATVGSARGDRQRVVTYVLQAQRAQQEAAPTPPAAAVATPTQGELSLG